MSPMHPHDDTLRYLLKQRHWDRRLSQVQQSTYQIVGVGALVWPLTYFFPICGPWIACVLFAIAVVPVAAAFALDGLEALVSWYNKPRA